MALKRARVSTYTSSQLCGRRHQAQKKLRGGRAPATSAADKFQLPSEEMADGDVAEVDENARFEDHGPLDLPKLNEEAAKTWVFPEHADYAERDYQRSIVETAIRNNTLVSLPTGLGKTFIAAVVMYNYFRCVACWPLRIFQWTDL